MIPVFIAAGGALLILFVMLLVPMAWRGSDSASAVSDPALDRPSIRPSTVAASPRPIPPGRSRPDGPRGGLEPARTAVHSRDSAPETASETPSRLPEPAVGTPEPPAAAPEPVAAAPEPAPDEASAPSEAPAEPGPALSDVPSGKLEDEPAGPFRAIGVSGPTPFRVIHSPSAPELEPGEEREGAAVAVAEPPFRAHSQPASVTIAQPAGTGAVATAALANGAIANGVLAHGAIAAVPDTPPDVAEPTSEPTPESTSETAEPVPDLITAFAPAATPAPPSGEPSWMRSAGDSAPAPDPFPAAAPPAPPPLTEHPLAVPVAACALVVLAVYARRRSRRRR